MDRARRRPDRVASLPLHRQRSLDDRRELCADRRVAALALNVLSGYAGQISLGIAFFMAIGAYTAAFLGGQPPSSPTAPLGLGLSFVIWLPAAGIVAALVGALVGPTALRLKGFYLGIVSLGLVFIGLHRARVHRD